MKTERRHELERNQLSDSLGHGIEVVRPYTRLIVGGVVAVVMLLFAWMYHNSQNRRAEAQGWEQYFQATADSMNIDAKSLADASERYPGTPVAQWSRIVLADTQLAQGASLLFQNKSEGQEKLKEAIDNYRSLIAESATRPVMERAQFGLARAHESLGELDQAREEYGALVKQSPDSPFVQVAKDRAEDLARGNTHDFYDWFAKYEPQKPQPRSPGLPGKRPDFNDPLEGMDIDTPSGGKSPLKGLEGLSPQGSPPAPGADDPARSSDKPKADDPPAAEKPAAEEPAGDSPAKQPSDDAPKGSDSDNAPKGSESKPSADEKPSVPSTDEKPKDASPLKAPPAEPDKSGGK